MSSSSTAGVGIRFGLAVLFVCMAAVGQAAAAGTPLVKALHREGAATLEQLFRAELDQAKAKRQPVVVMFTADWCQPCKMVKEFLEESKAVQKATRDGRSLFIDVAEWRGPAHQLIRGIDPSKLPVLVHVDYAGNPVQSCYGTDLGLVSDAAVAHNLGRLLNGQPPERQDFLEDPNRRRAAILEQAQRNKARVADVPPIELQVRQRKELGGGQSEWTVRLFVQSHDTRRRWYAIPAHLGAPLAEQAQAESLTVQRFSDHVRANWMRFEADPPFWVIPLGGQGSVELDKLVLRGPSNSTQLEVWELNRFEIDGKAPEFDKKVPFDLKVADASSLAAVGRPSGAVAVTLVPALRKTAPLK